jgi:hypothetical protein
MRAELDWVRNPLADMEMRPMREPRFYLAMRSRRLLRLPRQLCCKLANIARATVIKYPDAEVA